MSLNPTVQAAFVVIAGLLGGALAGFLLTPGRRSRSRWAAVSAVRGLCGAALSTVLVVIPSAVFVRESLGSSAHQLAVPAVRLDPSAAARYGLLPPFRDAVPVLTYHNLADSGGRNTVSPQEFARHLAMLRAAGFSSITAVQFEHFLAGTGQLPAKPILITFDDGVSSTWRAADPILKHYKMNAVLFVITSEIGRHAPYYLSSHELRDLRDSGRWELEAHTDAGHGTVPAAPSMKKAPFLTNREWLPAEDRYETLAEYELRIAGDLDRSIEKLPRSASPPISSPSRSRPAARRRTIAGSSRCSGGSSQRASRSRSSTAPSIAMSTATRGLLPSSRASSSHPRCPRMTSSRSFRRANRSRCPATWPARHRTGWSTERPEVGPARARRARVRSATAHLDLRPLEAQERAPDAQCGAAPARRPPWHGDGGLRADAGHPAGRQRRAGDGHGRPLDAAHPGRDEAALHAPASLLAPPRCHIRGEHLARRGRRPPRPERSTSPSQAEAA